MFAASWLRSAIGSLGVCVGSLLGWLLIAPWAALMPRRRDWLTVIGRDEGKFVDNTKYFFLQAVPLLNPTVRVTFLTERKDVLQLFAGTCYEALIYPSPRAAWHLLRSGTLIVDSIEWTRRARRFLTLGTKVLQLWHGVGFKRIELDKWSHEAASKRVLASRRIFMLRRAMHALTGRLVHYDAVNCTSEFYREHVFSHAFLACEFPITGYPRNTFGRLEGVASRLAWSNVDVSIKERLEDWAAANRRIILVTPTFRDSRRTTMGLAPKVVSMLDDWCETHNAEILFKFHPLERGTSDVKGEHLHLCDPASDLYPLMPVSSALVTDYSSIYMDYLLLDKPILFLVPDLEQYVQQDRQIQFDFAQMTPGPKVASWEHLVAELLQLWKRDRYSEERSRLRRMAFDDLPQDEAVSGLLGFMRRKSWIPGDGE